MPRPDQTALQMLEAQRQDAAQLFQSAGDAAAQERWIGEKVARQGSLVHLILRSTQRDPQGPLESAGVDDLYGDIIDPEFSLDDAARPIRSLVEHEPSKQNLKKYGIEEEREVVFWFPRVLLDEQGLITDLRFRGVDIGDLVVWDGTWYIAKEAHRDHYFGNTDHFFYTGAFCDRYHHNSVPTNAPRPCP